MRIYAKATGTLVGAWNPDDMSLTDIMGRVAFAISSPDEALAQMKIWSWNVHDTIKDNLERK